jgi:hypothetical protein
MEFPWSNLRGQHHARYAVPCRAMPCHAVPCCAVSWPRHAVPCHADPSRSEASRAEQSRAERGRAVPCHAMSCDVMPCHAMLCRALPFPAQPRRAGQGRAGRGRPGQSRAVLSRSLHALYALRRSLHRGPGGMLTPKRYMDAITPLTRRSRTVPDGRGRSRTVADGRGRSRTLAHRHTGSAASRGASSFPTFRAKMPHSIAHLTWNHLMLLGEGMNEEGDQNRRPNPPIPCRMANHFRRQRVASWSGGHEGGMRGEGEERRGEGREGQGREGRGDEAAELVGTDGGHDCAIRHR